VAQQAGGDAAAVAPDVAKAVYALAAASGSEAAYKMLVDLYEQVWCRTDVQAVTMFARPRLLSVLCPMCVEG
jgi:hypothetical protein